MSSLFNLEWLEANTYPWIIGAGVVLVLALVCYFLPLGKLRIPAGVLASVASLGIGLGLGEIGRAHV